MSCRWPAHGARPSFWKRSRSATAGCLGQGSRSAISKGRSWTTSLPLGCYLAILRSPVSHARLVGTTPPQAHPRWTVVTGRCWPSGPWRGCRPSPTTCRRCWPLTRSVPGRGLRRRRGPVRRAGRARADRRRLRRAPAGRRRTPRARPESPLIRDDVEGKTDNHCFDWEAGDARPRPPRSSRGRRSRSSRRWSSTKGKFTRRRSRPAARWPTTTASTKAHPSTCTTQAPHAHRTLYADAGSPTEPGSGSSPDIGGGFGNKVPIYRATMCAIVGSMITGRPIEVDRRGHTAKPAAASPRLHHEG